MHQPSDSGPVHTTAIPKQIDDLSTVKFAPSNMKYQKKFHDVPNTEHSVTAWVLLWTTEQRRQWPVAQRNEGLLVRILSMLLNVFDAPKIGSRIDPFIVGPPLPAHYTFMLAR